LIPPSEVLQHFSHQIGGKENEEAGGLAEGNEGNFSFVNMEKVMQTKINNDQLMAISTEKSIPYGTLQSKEKKKMKMSLLSLNHGTIKLDYLIFYEQKSHVYLKVQVPLSFVVT